MAIGDLDGDGHADLAVANQNSDDVSVLLNLGQGTFAPAVAYPAGNWPYSVAIGDLDGDGHADLAVANQSSDDVSVVLSMCHHAACAGDTDGDGMVSVDDLIHVILDWGTGGSAHGGDVSGALSGSPPDGIVDCNDLNAVILGWGACP